MAVVLGVDSSTQSTKVEARDADTGAVVGIGRGAHPPTTPPRSEQDPAAWWDALATAVRALDDDVRRDVRAIAVGAQQHGLVVSDGAGNVLRPAKLWNDTESAPQATALRDKLGAETWAEAVGLVPVASFTITKLAWLAEHEPATLAATRRVQLPHDWLTWRLCGEHVTDRGDASGSCWWSAADGTVHHELLALVDPDRDWAPVLPTVLGPTDVAGHVTAEAAAELGIGDGSPIVVGPGTGDNMSAALGLGLGPGDLVVSLGTSGTAYARSERATADASGLVAGFADAAGGFLPLICTLNATKVTDFVGGLIGMDAPALAAAALEAPPGAGGVVVVPYLDGERTPDLPDASAAICGLRSNADHGSLARAAHEGVACGLLEGVDALVDAGVDVDGRLLLVGGGARSAAYRRVVADLAARTVTVPDDDEVVATGAAAQAAAVLAGTSPDEVADRWGLGRGTTVEPDTTVDAAAIRARYRDMATRVAT
ncbi:MAG: xylulokinase [Actinomycetota bacterium]|nr:xylulokinase [Actinomycetota bacterium]